MSTNKVTKEFVSILYINQVCNKNILCIIYYDTSLETQHYCGLTWYFSNASQ